MSTEDGHSLDGDWEAEVIERLSEKYPMHVAILQAFDKLLKTTAYGGIRISDLCAAASVSAPTFYRYFKNKAAIAQWYTDVIDDYSICKVGVGLSWEESMRNALLLTRLFGRVACATGNPISDRNNPIYKEEYVTKKVQSILTRLVTEHARARLDDELEYQIRAAAFLVLNTVEEWKEQGMPADMIAPLSRYFAQSVPRRLYEVLQPF